METKERLNRILAKHTGQTIERIKQDSDRDNFMSAETARAYGLIDSMLEKRGELPDKAPKRAPAEGLSRPIFPRLRGADLGHRLVRPRFA